MSSNYINFEAARLCGFNAKLINSQDTSNISTQQSEVYVRALRPNGEVYKFDISSNVEDLMHTIGAIMRCMISIRATDGGTGYAWYDERQDVWGPGKPTILEAITGAIEYIHK